MKPKKIPRPVRWWLLLLGFYGGSLFARLELFIIPMPQGLYIYVIHMITSVGLWYFIGWKWRTTLQEWGIAQTKVKQIEKRIKKEILPQ